jgi:hypothetical protein
MRLFTLLVLLLSVVLSCTAAQQELAQRQAATAADVVNEVAKRGDQVYAVSVEACHNAELAAAALPDLETAKTTVTEIRQRCDVAFLALERLRLAVAYVDNLVEQLDKGAATVQQATAAAITARDAFERAQSAMVDLNTYLESLAQ